MTTKLVSPVRRELKIRGVEYVVELSTAGVMFRAKGKKARAVAPIGEILSLAEQHAKREQQREQLRAVALRRIGR